MNEHQLNAILGTTSDPVNNRLSLSSNFQVAEIQRMLRIFNINKEQKIKHKMLAIKNLATMKVVFSNN